jgi:hypothetical protein
MAQQLLIIGFEKDRNEIFRSFHALLVNNLEKLLQTLLSNLASY